MQGEDEDTQIPEQCAQELELQEVYREHLEDMGVRCAEVVLGSSTPLHTVTDEEMEEEVLDNVDTEPDDQVEPRRRDSSTNESAEEPTTARVRLVPQTGCQRPSIWDMRSVTDDKEYYTAGEEVTVQCNPGYYPTSQKTRCVTLDGDKHDWSPAVTCTAGCQRPSIENMHSVTSDKEYYTINEEFTVQCNTEYYPSSQRTRCVTNNYGDRVWSPAVTCTAGCQRPSMENMHSVTGDKEYYDINEEVTVWCNTGYFPSSQTTRCVKWGGDRHDWSPAVTCTAGCQRPSIGNMLSVTGDKEYYTINEEVTVQCNTGYYPKSQTMRCVTNSRGDRQWSPAVTCTAGCQRPSIGNMLSVTRDKEYYTADEWVTVWCNTGYYPTSQRTRCVTNNYGDRRWSPAVTCTAGCQRPSIGNMLSVTGNKEYYTINEEVTVQCNTGYYPKSQTMRCVTNSRGDRQWSPAVTCTAGCQRPSIGNMLSVTRDKEYYTADEWVTVWCNTGYYPTSQRTRCVTNNYGDRRWSPAVTCTAGCQRPSIGNMLSVTGNKEYYTINEEVTVQCNTGYYPKSQTMRCVTNSRGDRQWSPAVTCTVMCKRPGKRQPYTFYQDRDYYNPGEVVTVVCKEEGYRPEHPNITCVPSRGRYNWDKSPSCIERCKRPDKDKPYTFYQARDFYNPEEEVIVMCKEEGYRPSHQKVKCVSTGGKDNWDNSPSCIERCKRPDQDKPYTFSIDKHFYNPGEEVTVVCKEEGYRLSHPKVTCVFTGGKDNWDLPPTCIAQCRRPAIANLERLSADTLYYDRREGITAQCKPGYYPSSATMRCDNPGTAQEWTPPTMTCIGVTVPDAAVTSTSISFRTSCSPDCPPGWRFTTTCCDETSSPSCNTSSDARNGTFSSLQPLTLYRITTTLHRDGTSHLVWSSNITTLEPVLQPLSSTSPAIAGSVSAVIVLLVVVILVIFWRRHSSRKPVRSSDIPLKAPAGLDSTKLLTLPWKKKDISVRHFLAVVKNFHMKETQDYVEDNEEKNSNISPVGRYLEYTEFPSGLVHPCTVAQSEENQPKNRYRKVLPYDESRVKLRSSPSGSDYINASYIHGYKVQKSYIATQGE
ncbi:complement factor H-like [Hyperolius riggenbachi]|uniref:complement factor H-like n=1 Tax=Hyperolius riggenbachi TaxID=752182 RepID=UPI0035A364AC